MPESEKIGTSFKVLQMTLLICLSVRTESLNRIFRVPAPQRREIPPHRIQPHEALKHSGDIFLRRFTHSSARHTFALSCCAHCITVAARYGSAHLRPPRRLGYPHGILSADCSAASFPVLCGSHRHPRSFQILCPTCSVRASLISQPG